MQQAERGKSGTEIIKGNANPCPLQSLQRLGGLAVVPQNRRFCDLQFQLRDRSFSRLCRSGENMRVAGVQAPDFTNVKPCRERRLRLVRSGEVADLACAVATRLTLRRGLARSVFAISSPTGTIGNYDTFGVNFPHRLRPTLDQQAVPRFTFAERELCPDLRSGLLQGPQDASHAPAFITNRRYWLAREWSRATMHPRSRRRTPAEFW